MKIFNIFASVIVATGISVVSSNVTANALSIDTSPDCDKYSVMYCGAYTNSQAYNKLANGDGVNSAKNIRAIYREFGLTPNEVKAGSYVAGVVYKNGDVKVGKRLVATKAVTYIRTMGKVSTSRMATAQAAMVHLDQKGEFVYAIMTPCGNPVSGKAVPVPPTPTPPTPTPPTPTPPVPPTPPTPPTPPVPPTPPTPPTPPVPPTPPTPPTPPVPPTPVTPNVIPNTGPGSAVGLIGLFSGTSIIGALLYKFWITKKFLG